MTGEIQIQDVGKYTTSMSKSERLEILKRAESNNSPLDF